MLTSRTKWLPQIPMTPTTRWLQQHPRTPRSRWLSQTLMLTILLPQPPTTPKLWTWRPPLDHAITSQPTSVAIHIDPNQQQPNPVESPLKSKLVAFLLSLFIGAYGADWFYLSAGNSNYIFLGVLKLLTCGGCYVWWLVDWIRVLADTFPDGQGRALDSDNF